MAGELEWDDVAELEEGDPDELDYPTDNVDIELDLDGVCRCTSSPVACAF
jgi:hypothetical protein